MTHKIHIIQNKQQFDLIYNDFKESARISSEPDLYHVGLDTEYINSENHPESFSKCTSWVLRAEKIAVCKLQLATNTYSLVIDLCKFAIDLPDNLTHILTSPSWLKTGVGISLDLAYLSYNFDLGQCNGGIDCKPIAELSGCKNPNLIDLYKKVSDTVYTDLLDKKKSTNSMLDWSMDLTTEQIEYAGMDAIMSYKVGLHYLKALINLKTPELPSENKTIPIITATITNKNYIGSLQEYTQKRAAKLPSYEDCKCDDLNFRFKVSCKLANHITYGLGLTKKEAKNNAAKNMLKKIDQ